MILRKLKQLWHDERGAMNSAEIVLMTTILIIGSIVGLVAMRNQIVQEFGDLATALGAMNQTYSYIGETRSVGSTTTTVVGTVAGSSYDDLSDIGDGPDTAGSEPDSISVSGPVPVLRNLNYGEN